MKRRLLLLIPAFVLCVNVSQATKKISGGLTRVATEISTAEQLVAFATSINDGTATIKNAVVKKDIDASDVDFTPIGSSSNAYTGTFDGGGHTITLNIDKSEDNRIGLFGSVGAATIKNVTVAGTIKGNRHVGGIVGNAYNTTITNCHNKATVIGTESHIGGIVGYASSKSTDSNSSVSVSECSNTGSISGTQYIGGIVGYVYATSRITISKCVNEGSVYSSLSMYVGGIAGHLYQYNNTSVYNKKIIACANRGPVLCKVTDAILKGGIVGYSGEQTLELTSCYNEYNGAKLYGKVTTTKGITRCYDINSETNNGVETFTSEELESGALCYNLNGGVTDMYWYQTLTGENKDDHPVLTALANEANVVNKGILKEYGTTTSRDVYFNSTTLVENKDAAKFYEIEIVGATETAKSNIKSNCPETSKNILILDDDVFYCGYAELLDKTDYNINASYTAAKFTYNRTLATAEKGITTFMLPITTSVSNVNGKVYKLSSFDGTTLKFEDVTGDLEPNTPYLVENKEDGEQKLLTATLSNVSVSAMKEGNVTPTDNGNATHYASYTNKSKAVNGSEDTFRGKTLYGYADGKFVKATSTWTLPAFHTLIAVTGTSGAPSLSIDLGDGGTSGIISAEANGDGESVSVYSISGVKVRTNVNSGNALRDLPAGVYIVNGKKVVVKK